MDKYFFLNSNNEQVGPVSPEEFSRYGLNENTMVWKQGMANWMRAGQVPELLQFFRGTTPPPFPPSSSNAFANGSNSFGGSQPSMMKPDNNMVWAVLCTVLCCLPLGVYSIILASKVNGLYATGNYAEAQKAADDAKKWAGIGAVLGFVGSFIAGLMAALAQ